MIPTIELKPCPKAWTEDLDKARPPRETVAAIRKLLAGAGLDICAHTRRMDTGRLGIPVFVSVCGKDAADIMPARKQMGKGSSPAQAEASALMELMERYAFFSFWRDRPHFVTASWSEAEEKFGPQLIPLEQILLSVNDSLDARTARLVLDLVPWQFYPATRLVDGATTWLPLDWFRMLGEFNGSSAGNTNAESLLQGVSELVERHVSALISSGNRILPSIDLSAPEDPVLRRLIRAFTDNGIRLVLKDISLDMPLPTVAALAWDPATFPDSSEIVFTAGTATTPAKAAIRALTETAQLGGDFCTSSCYEASGLPKYRSLEAIGHLLRGPAVSLASLPSIARADMLDELLAVVRALAPISVYAAETTNPELGVPAHYCIAPGLQFRERDANQSLGLFTGRRISELDDHQTALSLLARLGQLLPDNHYLEFFQAMTHLRHGKPELAAPLFSAASGKQPDNASRALAGFYAGYALGQRNLWPEALPHLEAAASLDPEMRDYASHLGVALFKLGRYSRAEQCFANALKLDKGSAMDLANRGVCRMELGRLAGAREDLEAALELDPALDFVRGRLAALREEK